MLKSQEHVENNGLAAVKPCDAKDFLSAAVFVGGCSLGSKCSEMPSLSGLRGSLSVAQCWPLFNLS